MASARTPRLPARPVLAMLAALAAALAVTGCVSIPSAGPVRAYPVDQGPDAQNQPYLRTVTGPPGKNWTPEEVVTGFLTASTSFADNRQVARTYLTPQERKEWTPSWSAIVYKNGPVVNRPVYPAGGDNKHATVTVTGKVQANLSGSFTYAVPSASVPAGKPPTFHLVKIGGQWRISSPPRALLLTSGSFHRDYQLRNLYFFDPASQFLVPDPVYVPLLATPGDLVNGLVTDLISPAPDWLHKATHTAFPPGTKLLSDTMDGVTAVINLGGTIAKASFATREQVSAQLVQTLVGSGQAGQSVQSVTVEIKGKPFIPGGSEGNPVQRENTQYQPASGASKTFYYLDSAGEVVRLADPQKDPIPIEHVGTGFSQIAVSPDGEYLAALKQGMLYTGVIGGALAQRPGSGYVTMSWDPNDDLWATTSGQDNQIVMLRGDATTKQQLGQRTVVSVVYSDGTTPVTGTFTALRVAPDGVRAAIVINGTVLWFGAISRILGPKGAEPTLQIVLSPFHVSTTTLVTSLTWYGSDNVITLAQGPVVTEYPVNGGPAQDIPAEPQMTSIAASSHPAPLIAGLTSGRMVADASLTGAWTPVSHKGISPVYPG